MAERIERRAMPGIEFHDCGMAGAVFDNVDLSGATFRNVNLEGATLDDVNFRNVRIDNANIEGLTIYGYDIHALVQDLLERDNPETDLTDWQPCTAQARDWFESLRDRICAEFEAIEREAGSEAAFDYLAWDRAEEGSAEPGGGVRGLMKGQVFEKVGVNVSTVAGQFSPEFARTMHGAEDNPRFTATGISLVAHMANPHVPAVHMNTRFLTTGKAWFGGGADLNPPIPYQDDTEAFHARFRAACMAHNPTYYERFAKWADEYFFIPHRNVSRGVGGIFYDHLECGDEAEWERNFAFTKDVGEAFLDVFPKIVRKRMGAEWTPEEKETQLEWRGRYVEFNLVYDRGTLFGLKTGGNIDAILMSLPPEVKWS